MKKHLRLLIITMILLATASTAAIAQEERLDDAEIEQIAQSVVQIVGIRNGQPYGSGSGTIISPDGQIYTNRHVIEDGGEFAILMLQDLNELPVPRYYAEVIGISNQFDFAILQITQDEDGNPINADDLNLPFIEAENHTSVKHGDEISIFGYPGIGEGYFVFTRGNITSIQNGDVGDARMPILYLTDAEISPGNSGGLATDSNGNLLGIPTFVNTDNVTGGRLGGILPFEAISAIRDSLDEGTTEPDVITLGPPVEEPSGIPRLEGGEQPPMTPPETDCNLLQYGDRVTGTINNQNWAQVYCFKGNAGDQVTIDMVSQQGGLDGYLTLEDANGTTLTYNDDRATLNLDPKIENYALESSGLHYIIATRYNFEEGSTNGTFEITLLSDTVDAPDDDPDVELESGNN